MDEYTHVEETDPTKQSHAGSGAARPSVTVQARISLSIETFPALCVPQPSNKEVKIYTFNEKSKTFTTKRSQRPMYNNSTPQKRGFINSSLALSNSSLISASDLLRIRSLSCGRPRPNTTSVSNGKKRGTANNKTIATQNNKRSVTNLKLDKSVSKEMYKVSYPCAGGCANCAFTRCLGPVRVYVSQLKSPGPPARCGQQISAANGGGVSVPRSRRKEVRGLVYDKDMSAFYPPLPRRYRQTLGSNSNFYKYKLFY